MAGHLRIMPSTLGNTSEYQREIVHVMDGPVRAAGDYFVRCKCGWTSPPQDTLHAAASLHCGVEEAQLEGQRWAYVFTRKLREDVELDALMKGHR